MSFWVLQSAPLKGRALPCRALRIVQTDSQKEKGLGRFICGSSLLLRPRSILGLRITAEQLTILRICDTSGEMEKTGSLVAECYNYDTNGDVLVTSGEYSPILKNAKAAVAAHSSRQEVFPNAYSWTRLRDMAKTNPEDARKTGVLLMPRDAIQKDIPVDRLQESTVTYFLFGSNAETYGKWLKEKRVASVQQEVDGSDQAKDLGKPFSRALHIHEYWNNSRLVSGAEYFDLAVNHRMYGVRILPPDIVVPGR